MKLEVKRKRSRIEIVSMIDVIFFMLVFFVLFSTLKESQTGIEVDLPKTANMGAVQDDMVVISLRADSSIFFGKKQIELAELESLVHQELNEDEKTKFIIKPDADVSYREIIRITDVLAGSGVDKPWWGVDRQQMPNNEK